MRICIEPTTFAIHDFQEGQNPYVDSAETIDPKKVKRSHDALVKALGAVSYTVSPRRSELLPDIVFTANAGLSLPGLPESVVILPNMKYAQRKEELPYIRDICRDLGIRTLRFPNSNVVFEGQAEAKWFHGGRLLVCGYGHRSTRRTFSVLRRMLDEIYGSYGLTGPRLLVLPIESADYYHLDVAMLEFDGDSCVVHERAFSPASIALLKKALGSEKVHVLRTKDSFCLNAIVDGSRLITHTVPERVRLYLEKVTGRRVHPIDTTPFELAGGSVRCMVLDIY